MSTEAKERYFGGIQFISQSKEHGRLDCNVATHRKHFQFREDQENPLIDLAWVRAESGLNLYLSGTWSSNMENGIGYDPNADALALTTEMQGGEKGSLGEFAHQGLYILTVGIRNLRPIDDIKEVRVKLFYGRRAKTAVHLVGSLPNLGMSQPETIEGLISIGAIGESKEKAKGTSLIKPYVQRIPGVIEKWVKDPYGLTPLYVMSSGPEDLSVLSSTRGALRVLYNLS